LQRRLLALSLLAACPQLQQRHRTLRHASPVPFPSIDKTSDSMTHYNKYSNKLQLIEPTTHTPLPL
jgi:hypothetical protein